MATRQIPNGFAGIWTSAEGQVIALLGSHPSQIRFNGFEYDMDKIAQVPDGDFVGRFIRYKWLGVLSDDVVCYVDDETLDRIVDSHVYYSRSSDVEQGEFRFALGPALSNGAVSLIKASLLTENQHVKLSDSFYWSFGFDKVSFQGDYTAPHFSLHIGKSSDGKAYKGTLIYNDVKYLIKGVRTGIRLGFELYDMDYNRYDGRGYIDWTPTRERISKIKDGDEVGPDSVYLFVGIDKVLGNTKSLELKG